MTTSTHSCSHGPLPVELLEAIIKIVKDDESSNLLSLRLVSKVLNQLSTPLAFREIVIKDSVKSAQAVAFVQSCDGSLRSLVREVIFKGDAVCLQEDEESTDSLGEDNREALQTVFSGLAKFDNMKSLKLVFHELFEEEDSFQLPGDPSHYLRLQRQIFRALSSSPPPVSLISLTMQNVISMPDDIYLDQDFHQLFTGLQDLSISVLSDVEYEGSYYQDPLVDFWAASMTALVGASTGLTGLTIRSDQIIGTYPALSFAGVSMPRLSSLTLYDFALEPLFSDSDAVVFILRHKPTLEHLKLVGCSIDGGEEGEFTRPWHAVFSLFEAELDNIQEFVFNAFFDAKSLADADEFERKAMFIYTRLDPGWGYLPWDEELPTANLDLPALESLLAVVESRRSSSDLEK
ncbi:Pribosyltran domain-containing protein [Favolaschia claudopus]|uniref:Pribosyltran domain-containing protein n=1 Tax=Favolaschia claudopus TaxID=2862362 RepID=A0AAW0CWH8_9AGAR